MASKRINPKGAIAGLRSAQVLTALAVPTTLDQVPEDTEIKEAKPTIFDSDDWKRVQSAVQSTVRGELDLSVQGELYGIHQSVKNILRSKTGTFLCDCYKEWLTKEFTILLLKLRNLNGPMLFHCLGEIWTEFFSKSLPLLEALLFMVKPKGRLSIRCVTLSVFRDVVLFNADLEDALRKYRKDVTAEIEHFILVLQNVNDSYPPNKNKLRFEYLASQICDRFWGYYGLYENSLLIATSNEPAINARRRPSGADIGGYRRLSRPFSVQPQQMDTLNQMFKKALRHRTLKSNR